MAHLWQSGAGVQHAPHVFVKTLVRLAQFAHVAGGRPRFARHPARRLRHAGDKIKFAALRRDVIDHDVPVESPPLGARRPDVEAVQQRRRKHRPVRDAPFVQRLVRPNDDVAHQRMHAVGANHGVGFSSRAVGKLQRHAPRSALLEPRQLLAQMKNLRRQNRSQRVVQVRAMHAQIGRAEEALRHGQFAHHFARVPLPVQVRIRLKGGAPQPFLDANLAQHLHGVGHHLDARAHARKAPRLLVNSARRCQCAAASRPPSARRSPRPQLQKKVWPSPFAFTLSPR